MYFCHMFYNSCSWALLTVSQTDNLVSLQFVQSFYSWMYALWKLVQLLQKTSTNMTAIFTPLVQTELSSLVWTSVQVSTSLAKGFPGWHPCWQTSRLSDKLTWLFRKKEIYSDICFAAVVKQFSVGPVPLGCLIQIHIWLSTVTLPRPHV